MSTSLMVSDEGPVPPPRGEHVEPSCEIGPLLLNFAAKVGLVGFEPVARLGEMFLLKQVPVFQQCPFLLQLTANSVLLALERLPRVGEFAFLLSSCQLEFLVLRRHSPGQFVLEFLFLLLV